MKSYFAMCLVAKDEPDLLEWIDYHHRMGCKKFYIFDNDSKDPMLGSIIPIDYLKSGLVEYTYVQRHNEINNQFYVYERCLHEFGHRHTFMAFIDADEFIVIDEVKVCCNI